MKRTCLIVLGMHRSGTSALGGVFHNLGVSMGKQLMPPADENPKGFFENENITFYNDFTLFPFLESSWDNLEPLDIEKKLSNIPQDMIDKASEIIEESYKELDIFGIKDPRMCVLIPFWEKILRDLNIEIKHILPYRNPLEVANSLKVRNSFSIEKGLLLWAKYVLYAEYYSRDFKRVFISYDNLLDNAYRTIRQIEKALDIYFPITFETSKDTINEFLEKSLKHHDFELPDSKDDLSEFIARIVKLYDYLIYKESYCSDEIMHEFDALREGYKAYLSNYLALLNLGSAKENRLFVSDGDKKYFAKADDINPEVENNSLSYIVKAIPDDSIVLDVGCSYGYLGEWLVKNKNCQVYGIDINNQALGYVKERGYYKDVYWLDLDYPKNTKDEFERFEKLGEMFDFVVCADVLEHLKNPTDALNFVASKLKYGGQILISIPNIAHMDIILNLLEGKFNYSEFGILDNTHLRFFTKRSFAEWIRNANEYYKSQGFKFDLRHIGSTTYLSDYQKNFINQYSKIYSEILKSNPELEMLQHIFVLTKINASSNPYNLNELLDDVRYKNPLSEISTQLKEQKDEIERLNIEVNTLKSDLTDKESSLQAVEIERTNLINQLNEQNDEIERLNIERNTLKSDLAFKESSLQAAENELISKDVEIKNLSNELANKDLLVQELNSKATSLENELISVLISRSWRYTRPIRKLLHKLNLNRNQRG